MPPGELAREAGAAANPPKFLKELEGVNVMSTYSEIKRIMSQRNKRYEVHVTHDTGDVDISSFSHRQDALMYIRFECYLGARCTLKDRFSHRGGARTLAYAYSERMRGVVIDQEFCDNS